MDLIRKALGRQAPDDDASNDTGRDLAVGEQDQPAAQSSDPIKWHEEMVVKGSNSAGVQPGDPDGIATIGDVDPQPEVARWNMFQAWPKKVSGDEDQPQSELAAAAGDAGAEQEGAVGANWAYQILPDMEPDEPESGPAGLASDAGADTDKLEAYEYPGEYAQRFDGIDKSAGGGDGQPDLIVGTATGGAAAGQGSGGMADGSVRHIGSPVSGSTWGSDDAGDDGLVALADQRAGSPSGAGGPSGITAEDDWETPVAATDDGGRPAESGVAAEDDDEPLMLADLSAEGSRPLSDSAPVAGELPDVPEADEMPELDEADV